MSRSETPQKASLPPQTENHALIRYKAVYAQLRALMANDDFYFNAAFRNQHLHVHIEFCRISNMILHNRIDLSPSAFLKEMVMHLALINDALQFSLDHPDHAPKDFSDEEKQYSRDISLPRLDILYKALTEEKETEQWMEINREKFYERINRSPFTSYYADTIDFFQKSFSAKFNKAVQWHVFTNKWGRHYAETTSFFTNKKEVEKCVEKLRKNGVTEVQCVPNKKNTRWKVIICEMNILFMAVGSLTIDNAPDSPFAQPSEITYLHDTQKQRAIANCLVSVLLGFESVRASVEAYKEIPLNHFAPTKTPDWAMNQSFAFDLVQAYVGEDIEVKYEQFPYCKLTEENEQRYKIVKQMEAAQKQAPDSGVELEVKLYFR